MRPMARIEDREASRSIRAWRERLFDTVPERGGELFSTISGVDVEPLYGPENVDVDYGRDLGYPGEAPFTRGVYPSMYRGRLWTMRQFAGFGTAEETNARFHYLLDHGQTGLSTAFDMPTLMGYDSDHPRSLGEVGREGVAVDSLDDMETLFSGIPLGEVSTSMTINSPAAIVLAYYVCVGEEQGVPRDRLRGTRRRTSSRSTSPRRSGSSRPSPPCGSSSTWSSSARARCRSSIRSRSPATTFARPGRPRRRSSPSRSPTGSPTCEAAIERGLDVEDFTPRLSFFFNAHLDFFEEIAKYRAARRIWARELRDRYGATSERARRCASTRRRRASRSRRSSPR